MAQPRDRLFDAVDFYSGGAASVLHGSAEQWNGLRQLLQMNNLDPMEYIFWLVFFPRQTLREDMPEVNPSVLRMRNLVCSPKVVNDFIAWRLDSIASVPHLVRSQLFSLDNYLAQGLDLATLLQDPLQALSPPIRIELGLERLPGTEYQWLRDKLNDTYGELALTMCVGWPVYRQFAPQTTEWARTWLFSLKGITF